MANDTSLFFDFLERRNTVIPAAGRTAAAIAALDRATKASSVSMSRSNQRTSRELFQIDNVMRNTSRRMVSRMLLIGGAIVATAGHAVALTGALWPMVGALAAVPAVAVGAVAGVAALITGFSGLGAAMQRTQTGARTDEAVRAYRKLSVAGRQLVDMFHSLGPAWRRVQQGTQQSLLAGLAGDVKGLSERWLPVMSRQLPAIAQGWNNLFRSIARVASGAGFIADMDRSLGLQAVMWQRIGNAFGPFLSGFRHWVSVGSEFMPRFGSWVDRQARRFELWSVRVRESGDAFRWIDNAIETGHTFNELIKSWGRSLFEVFRLGQDRSLLDNLMAGSKAFEKWLSTAQGQRQVTLMWERMREVGSAAWTVIKELLSIIAQFDFSPLATILKVVGSLLSVMADNMVLVNVVGAPLIAFMVSFKVATMVTQAALALYSLTVRGSAAAMASATVAARAFHASLGLLGAALLLIEMIPGGEGRYQGMARSMQTVGSAFRDASKELQTYSDLLRAQTDPLFRYQQAQDNLTDAQRRYNEAVAQFGPGSAEAQRALEDMARAELDVVDATKGLATVNGPELTRWLEEMVRTGNLSRESADLLLATINKIPAAIAKVDGSRIRLYFEPWTTNMAKGGAQPSNKPIFFHEGGVVPGPRGTEVAAVLEAGEGVTSLQQMDKAKSTPGSRDGLDLHVWVHADEASWIKVGRTEVRKRGGLASAFPAGG